MKYIKRTLALLLAVVLVLALSISAFAVDTNGSIKVDNAVVNKTYTLYRIFDLDSLDRTLFDRIYTPARKKFQPRIHPLFFGRKNARTYRLARHPEIFG